MTTNAPALDDLAAGLRDRGARQLVVTYVDTAGISRARTVPAARFASAARSGLGLSHLWNAVGIGMVFGEVPPYDTPSGDIRSVPDLTAAALLPDDGWAWAPGDLHDQDGQRRETCPREVVRRVERDAAGHGLTFQVAIELELTLLHEDGTPVHHGPGYSLPTLLRLSPFVDDYLAALERAGVPVEQVHTEAAPGQIEVSVEPASPLVAADRTVLVRTVTQQVARRHGLRASFAPVPFADSMGNGLHLHLSAWRDGVNLLAGAHEQRDADADGLLGGLVEALPGLLAVLAPSVPSYRRLQPGAWAGATACWGIENREAAIRLIPGSRATRAESANVEVKAADGAANPYLAVGVVLQAALDGIRDRTPAPEPFQGYPSALTEQQLASHGIEPLPRSLEQAIEPFAASAVARRALGENLHRVLVAVRTAEWARYGSWEVDALLDEHRWQY